MALAGRHLCARQYIDPTLSDYSPPLASSAGARRHPRLLDRIHSAARKARFYLARDDRHTRHQPRSAARCSMIFGPTAKSLPEIFGRRRIGVFDIMLTSDKIGIVVCSIVMLRRRRAVDEIEPAWSRDSRHDDEPARRIDRRHRHPADRVSMSWRSPARWPGWRRYCCPRPIT